MSAKWFSTLTAGVALWMMFEVARATATAASPPLPYLAATPPLPYLAATPPLPYLAATPPLPYPAASPPLALKVVGDGIPESLAAAPGDPTRGRSLVLSRDPANCLLCHAIPDSSVRFAGNLGPSLGGIGARMTLPQLRLRVADIIRLNPATIMPSYYRVEGLSLVASAYRGKPILTASEIEDIVAYLATLR